MILEEYKKDTKQRVDDIRSTQVVTSSARTQAAYQANLARLVEWLKKNPNTLLQDLAYSTSARREHHTFRFALTASTTQEAVSKLEAEIERAALGAKSAATDVVFMYTGQGSHYAGMGSELYRTNSVFRRTVDLCVSICAANGFPAFLDIITDSTVDVSAKNAAQIQLAVVTLEISLTAFWHAAGIKPAMVMGHSLGEYAALHAAGVLSLTDTLYLVGQRARLLLERCEPDSCAMLSVTTSVAAVREQLTKLGESSLQVACINSPSATVISGTAEDLAKIKTNLTAQDAKVRTTMLSVPFAFHSFQMDAILADYKTIASGVTYLPPKVPVASTLLSQVVNEAGIFSEEYLALQTRQAVDFCGGLNVAKAALKNPLWLEIGPGPVCTSFVRATLSPPPTKINHSIESKAGNWVSISKTLTQSYMSGVDVDWLALHAPYEQDLELLSLPTYAWDVKDYWITHTDRVSDEVSQQAPVAAPSEPFLATTAQYLVEKSLSPKVKVTFRSGISDHGFMGVIDGHKMQGIGLASGSVFSDSAAAVAKYALEYSGRKNVTAAHLTFHEPELLAPLTRDLVGIDGALLSTATMESATSDAILVTFKATSKSGKSQDLGSMRVRYRDPEPSQAALDRVSFYIKSKLDERIRQSKEGSGHRIQPNVFYALFANAVEFSADFQGVQEAYVASDFQEAAATIMLKPDPVGTRFTSSPYWGEALFHLAGFMVNGNPAKSPQSTFVVMGYETVEQLAPVEVGKEYITYTRIEKWENDTAYCAAYVFEAETGKIVMYAVNLRYQEFKTATWRHILGGAHEASHHAAPKAHKPAATEVKAAAAAPVAATAAEQPAAKADEPKDAGVFQKIVAVIANSTGSDPSEFTDDALIADIGVDSIMAIEVTTHLEEQGVHLPAGFVFEYPTIGDLRRAFGGSEDASSSEESSVSATPDHSDDDVLSLSGDEQVPSSSVSSASSIVHIDKEPITPAVEAELDLSPQPSVRITLLQGRPNFKKAPIYMMADGTGTVASFLHLRPFKSRQAVYGVDSPYFRCPSRMTSAVGIQGVASLIVDALVRAQGAGEFLIGGYSAGCLVAFEVCRQLAAKGRVVAGLLLIDMCAPRTAQRDQKTLLEEDAFSYEVFEKAVNRDGLWSTLSSSRDHFRAFFVAMNEYTPEPLAPYERPRRTAVVWAEKGLINRVSDDVELVKRVEAKGVPVKPYKGFMEDPRLGTFACLVPDKGAENLGPNGWDRFTGGEVLVGSVSEDHFGIFEPVGVPKLQGEMEKAFEYFHAA